MEVQVILELMREMRQNGIETLEWQVNGQSLRLVRPAAAAAVGLPGAAGSAAGASPAGAIGSNKAGGEGGHREGRLVTSPVVGVFFAAPAPDQAPFVALGGTVEAGAPLGIIEAMKLMNEVASPCSGTVLEILVENGQRVEYGQPLFVIKENGR